MNSPLRSRRPMTGATVMASRDSNGNPGDQDSGSELICSGDLLVAAGTGGWASVALGASLEDSMQNPISDELISVTVQGSSGSTAVVCGLTGAEGSVACDADLAPDVHSVSLYFAGITGMCSAIPVHGGM